MYTTLTSIYLNVVTIYELKNELGRSLDRDKSKK